MSEHKIEVTASPPQDDIGIISTGLAAFNESDVGPADRMPIAVLVRHDAGAIVGGISSYTA